MPKQFHQPSAPPAEHKDSTAEWVISKIALHQHRQPVHALSHVGPPAGEINANPGTGGCSATIWMRKSGNLDENFLAAM